MAAAAVTPRVRILAVCNDVVPSELENDVFTLEGVRQHLTASKFPWACRLCVYLLLSSARKGTYRGRTLILDDNHTQRRVVRYVKLSVTFQQDNEHIVRVVEIDSIVFPASGWYTFEIGFEDRDGNESVKGEHPFRVFEAEE